MLQGPLRGARWIAGSATHGCWLGSYEIDKQQVVRAAVHSGATVYDIGANVGFYTLLFSRLVGQGGRVIAFEPLTENLDYLRQHVAENNVSNVTVVNAAVADVGGELRFARTMSRSMGKLTAEGEVVVQAVRLDDLVAEGFPKPDFLKIDVEGAEARVLSGAQHVLRSFRPTIFLATHGADVRARCEEILRDYMYELTYLDGSPDELIATCRSGS